VLQSVDLSLFYFVHGTDGFVLWGEGLVTSQGGLRASVSSTNLGDGLRLLRVTNDFATVARVLQEPVFNYRHQGTTAIQLGLKPRPPVMALPGSHTLGTTSAAQMHQFVRLNKADALGTPPGGQGGVPREELERVLGRAQAVLGLNFRDTDAPHLGDVVLIEDVAHAPPPVSFMSVRGSGAFPEAVRVDIDQHARKSELVVNLRIIGSDDAVLDDVLFRWVPGMEPSFVLPTNQRFGGVELRVWRDGRLVWMSTVGFILELGLNMQLMSGTLVLSDRLTNLLERAIQAGNAPASALPQTRTVAQHAVARQSMIGANQREPWRQAFLSARGEVFTMAPPPPPRAEYFPQGGGGRASAIQAFVQLLQGGRSFLVDPFFDALGAADLLPRVAGDVDLTVITSLPDDGQPASEQLVAYLHEARGYLPQGIKVRRVTRQDTNEQAFHDRYLVVVGGEGPPRGFLLSNSFSGLARKYPMVVAGMSVGTTAAVLEDIQRMLASKNVSALWPPPPPGPYVHDTFGDGWRWYLGQLVACRGRDIAKWLAAASAERWLVLESDGNPRWSTARQTAVLDRLLPRRPSGSCLPRAGRRGRRGRQRPVPLGFRLAAVGERVVRGLKLDVPDVVGRLGAGDARKLGQWLRTSFRSPETWERHGHWRTRVAVRQALQDPVVTPDRVRFGLSLWSDTHVVMDLTREFGRAFVYRVLLALDPKVAIAVAIELGDPTFIAASLDWWHIDPWPTAVTQAALSSSSAMLKALGVQSIAAPTTRGDHSSVPDPPPAAAVSQLLRELEGVDATVVAFACLEWGPRVSDAGARRELIGAIVKRLPHLSVDNLRAAAMTVLGNRDLLIALGEVLPSMPGAGMLAIDSVTAALLQSVSAAVADHQWGELADRANALSVIILAKYGENFGAARAGLEELFDLPRTRTLVDMVSPFRRHPDWRRAITLLGLNQVLLLHLRARSGEDVDLELGPLWSLIVEASPALHTAIVKAVQEL